MFNHWLLSTPFLTYRLASVLRMMKYSLWALSGLLGMAACQPQANQTATTPPPAAKPPATAPLASSPGTAYHVYRTLLPGQADSITLHLTTTPYSYDAPNRSGHLGSYYGANGRPYEVQSQPSTPDSVVLTNIDATSQSHSWRLRQQPDGGLAGTIGGQAVRLVPVPAGSPGFVVRYFTDSLVAIPQAAKSPRAHLIFQALLPTGGPAAPRQTLEEAMLHDLSSDTAGLKAPPTLAALYQQHRTTFFENYRAAVADLPTPTDTADAGSYRASLTYDDQTGSYVLFHRANLLSVGYFTYSYGGGSTASYRATTASYDLRTGRRLRYEDIFRPTAAAQLSALLSRAMRPLLDLQPGEHLLGEKIPVTHNVFLTTGGAVFTYQNNEIAGYSLGEMRVFIPLAQLRPLLREGLPLPSTSPVARR